MSVDETRPEELNTPNDDRGTVQPFPQDEMQEAQSALGDVDIVSSEVTSEETSTPPDEIAAVDAVEPVMDGPLETADTTPAVDETSDENITIVPSAFKYAEQYYQPASADAPTGAAVEFYHFAEMDQALVWPTNDFGRPDPSERPNFRAVRDMALGFLNGSKEIPATRDVRPMLALAIAEAGDKGPVGFAKALDLFVATAMAHWDALHPQKEDDDDDELMTRMEEIRKYFNPAIIALAVESVGIARSPRVGDLTTRTFGIALTKVSPREGEFAPNAEALTKLLSEEEEARASVEEAQAAYTYAIERLNTFEAFLGEHPDVDPVDLAAVVSALDKQVAFLNPFVNTEGAADAAGVLDVGEESQIVTGTTPSSPISGPNTLPEAMGLIDDILQFYAQSGRSSPVPLGLIALRDLMAGDFNTWISQTASSGLADAAINISTVDASRLSSFASGDAPAAAAPVNIDLDFSEIDSAIFKAQSAYTALDNGVYQLQQTLAPDEGAEENTVLNEEVQALRAALDEVIEAKRAMEAGPKTQAPDAPQSDNGAEGDARHSRITDRSGVRNALDAVAAYFEREEPSSPAPAYLRRLKSLVDARFIDIARELMPEDGGEAKLRLESKTNLR